MPARDFGAFKDDTLGFPSLEYDLYSLLNVPSTATIKEIEKKKRQLSLFTHTDKL